MDRKPVGTNYAMTKKIARSFSSAVVGASAPIRNTKSAAKKKKGA